MAHSANRERAVGDGGDGQPEGAAAQARAAGRRGERERVVVPCRRLSAKAMRRACNAASVRARAALESLLQIA